MMYRVREKFADYRWVPLEPDFIEYPNAQVLMIGEAQGELGKAATAEPDGKREYEEQPGQELDKLGHENEERIESLQGTSPLLQAICLPYADCHLLKAMLQSTRIWDWTRRITHKCHPLGMMKRSQLS